MTEPQVVELWPCGYVAKCSAPDAAGAPLRSCAISTARSGPITRPKPATPTRAGFAPG
jgi:hypothetical protein